jgi:hypothetical protein
MISERDRFYKERDRRSLEYGVFDLLFDEPIAVTADNKTVESEQGQLVILSLINMLARIHRTIYIATPDVPLMAKKTMFRMGHCSGLQDAINIIATSINPYINIFQDVNPTIHAGIGIGREYKYKMPWYVGTDSNMVLLDNNFVDIKPQNGFSLGPCMASCIAASVIIKQLLNMIMKPIKISAWNLKEGDSAKSGPEVLEPLDVGKVFLIGAGGVGSCLTYWLRQVGIVGQWSIVDGDITELHNTNRCLGTLARDAGWPNQQPKHKAEIAAELIGSSYHNKWYDDVVDESLYADLILPLANEHGVRNKISQRGDNVILHATTSKNWEAQLHRHIAGRDDCIVCRMPRELELPKFKCSTVVLPNNQSGSNDTALSFLSASAGFLLLNGLYRLMYGELTKEKCNWWRMIFNSNTRFLSSGKWRCSSNCSILLPETTRNKINTGKRWAHIK